MNRTAVLHRKTKETEISVRLDLDGFDAPKISTGIGFFDHLLEIWATHARVGLSLEAAGDLHVDAHHTVEDAGIVLGGALDKALGERTGISRFGHAYCPLDEALARAVVDLSGRGFFAYGCPIVQGAVGQFPVELFEEFARAFALNARLTLHLDLIAGRNSHHVLEAMTKACARAVRMAVRIDPDLDGIPSTKGILV